MTKIYFDMDGTIADLYGQKDWLLHIKNFNADVYRCKPLIDMKKLNAKLEKLVKTGKFEIGIITWLAGYQKNEKFNNEVTEIKREWIKKYLPVANSFTVLKYGVPKHSAIKRNKKMILFDDNKEVRKDWNTPKQRVAYSEKEIFKILEEIS